MRKNFKINQHKTSYSQHRIYNEDEIVNSYSDSQRSANLFEKKTFHIISEEEEEEMLEMKKKIFLSFEIDLNACFKREENLILKIKNLNLKILQAIQQNQEIANKQTEKRYKDFIAHLKDFSHNKL